MALGQKKKSLGERDGFICRYCGKSVEKDSGSWQKFQPFCSDKCRLADLDCWFDGDYVIPGGPIENEDEPPPGWSKTE